MSTCSSLCPFPGNSRFHFSRLLLRHSKNNPEQHTWSSNLKSSKISKIQCPKLELRYPKRVWFTGHDHPFSIPSLILHLQPLRLFLFFTFPYPVYPAKQIDTD